MRQSQRERQNDFGDIGGTRALALRSTRSTTPKRLQLLALLVVASAAAGGLYSVIRAPPDVNWVVQIATGATIGSMISSCIIGFELFGAGQLLDRGGCWSPLAAAVSANGCIRRCHHGRPANLSRGVLR